MLGMGLSNREIAEQLRITIHRHKPCTHSVLTKLGVSSRADAAVLARTVQHTEGSRGTRPGLSENWLRWPMYDGLRAPDSNLVHFGFARDPGRRPLANGSSSSAGSTSTVVSSRLLRKPGFATSESFHFVHARVLRSPIGHSFLQLLRFDRDSQDGILGLTIAMPAASARVSLSHSTAVRQANSPSGQMYSSTGNC